MEYRLSEAARRELNVVLRQLQSHDTAFTLDSHLQKHHKEIADFLTNGNFATKTGMYQYRLSDPAGYELLDSKTIEEYDIRQMRRSVTDSFVIDNGYKKLDTREDLRPAMPQPVKAAPVPVEEPHEPRPKAKDEIKRIVKDPTPEPVPEAAPEPPQVVAPEPVPEAKPEPVQEAKPEPEQETKPEPAAEIKPEPVPEVKTETRRDVAPELEWEPKLETREAPRPVVAEKSKQTNPVARWLAQPISAPYVLSGISLAVALISIVLAMHANSQLQSARERAVTQEALNAKLQENNTALYLYMDSIYHKDHNLPFKKKK